MLDENEGILGTQCGYFERVQDRVPTTSAPRLQQLLSAGLSFSSIHDRLLSIEGSIASLKAPAFTHATGGIKPDIIERRIWAARAAADKSTSPVFYLSAAALQECDFPTLFESASERVVRLVENPPKLRPDGFGLNTFRPSEILEARLRRSVSTGYRLMELWKDGLLISVGPGDEDFLAWAAKGEPDGPIRINNFVLAESVLLFCWLTQLVFLEAKPQPETIRVAAGFDNLTRGGNPAILHNVPNNWLVFPGASKAAPNSKLEVFQIEDWPTFDPEEVGCRLFGGIYNWFGFDSERLPYTEKRGSIQKLSAEIITGRSLPPPSDVPTPSQL